MKEELLNAEDIRTRQNEDLKLNLTAEYKIKLDKIQNEKDEEKRLLKQDLDETILNLESSRKNHREEILFVENSKQQSLAIAHQEQQSLTERLNEALNNMDELNRDLERHRRDSSNRSEKDRASISELQIEISKLKSLLSDKDNQLDDDKKNIA